MMVLISRLLAGTITILLIFMIKVAKFDVAYLKILPDFACFKVQFLEGLNG